MANENKTMDSLIEKIHKIYGDSVSIIKASDSRFVEAPRVSTGIFVLDCALGGGIPRGKISIFWGKEKSGKSTSALKTVASVQKNGGIVVWLDAESSFDQKWAEKNGVILEKLLLITKTDGNTGSEKQMDAALDLIKSGKVDLVVIDSIASLRSTKEIEAEADESKVGAHPKMIGNFVNRLMAYLGSQVDYKTTILALNQVRDKIGVMYGDPAEPPGGHTLKHGATVTVKMSLGKYEMDKKGFPMYVNLNFIIMKSRVGPAKLEGTYKMYVTDREGYKSGEIIEVPVVLDYGIKYGVLKKNQSRMFLFNGKEIGEEINVEEYLRKDNKLFEEVRNAVMDAMVHNVLNGEDTKDEKSEKTINKTGKDGSKKT